MDECICLGFLGIHLSDPIPLFRGDNPYCHSFINIMKYGVPYEQFVNEFSDIDYEYRWFNTMDDANEYARTLDVPWDVFNMVIEC